MAGRFLPQAARGAPLERFRRPYVLRQLPRLEADALARRGAQLRRPGRGDQGRGVSPVQHSKPWLPESCSAAVAAALRSGMIGQGEKTREFERAASAWVGAEGGVAVGSGSAAIFLSLAALGAGRGSEVILPTYVCPSVMEAVATSGATPVLCDAGR